MYSDKSNLQYRYDGYQEAKLKEDEREQGLKALQRQMNEMDETMKDILQTHDEFAKFMKEHEDVDDKGLAEVMKIFPRGSGKYKYEEVIERFRRRNK
jgi:uncharacterized protein with von Willebrand factor type A (vWA) domain